MLDERLARHLHLESLRHRDLHPEHEAHVLFQASTIGALLDGAYDGDVSFAELAEHGDLGLGTLNALDGEMIALDGRFYRADVGGTIGEVPPSARTPFAALAWFEPTVERRFERPLDYEELLGELDRAAADAEATCALRVDGEFELVRARSVPRQSPPYRPLDRPGLPLRQLRLLQWQALPPGVPAVPQAGDLRGDGGAVPQPHRSVLRVDRLGV